MKLIRKTPTNLLFASILFAFTACSSGPVVQDYPKSALPTEEIAKLEEDIHIAQRSQVDLLSPKNFKEAHDALRDAKNSASEGKDPEDTLRYVAVGRSYLSDANATAAVAKENITEVVDARRVAINAEAASFFPKEFASADNEFAKVTKDIEKNRFQRATDRRSALQEKYLALELKAIKEKNLGESRKIIDMAKKEKAEKFAPKTLAIAEKHYIETEAYIKANRHDTKGIAVRATDTREAAMHAFNINRTAKGSNKVSSEEMALAIEKERLKVAAREGQLKGVKGELVETVTTLEGTASANAALIEQQRKLLEERNILEAEKEFNAKYELARKQFSSDEAEVYKQGDALLIRLKGMEFPSAKAEIQPRNEPLLLKVQKVMEEFGSSTVVVEGHTDSVGAKIVNDRLSQNRAEAVKNYLQSNNGALSPDEVKIEAVGLGDKKPLATNKTADGRAQNRRVDIVIKPDTSKL
ncbi:MAG: OmpA family protein [Bacteriovorax sp.]|jgi:outer membrane protein OmpA-like peptidoglycan-associated protein